MRAKTGGEVFSKKIYREQKKSQKKSASKKKSRKKSVGTDHRPPRKIATREPKVNILSSEFRTYRSHFFRKWISL